MAKPENKSSQFDNYDLPGEIAQEAQVAKTMVIKTSIVQEAIAGWNLHASAAVPCVNWDVNPAGVTINRSSDIYGNNL